VSEAQGLDLSVNTAGIGYQRVLRRLPSVLLLLGRDTALLREVPLLDSYEPSLL
jgi:hypothetical protein